MNAARAAMASRRRLLVGGASASGMVLVACAGAPARNGGSNDEEEGLQAEVTPGEDLMQEHGVLERLLLLYEEAARRIERGEAVDGAVVHGAAGVVRRFVEDYHEELEEQHVFPRLEAAGSEVALIAVLREQHRRGRELTDEILRRSGAAPGAELAQALQRFSRMVRPHAAREDTVLFPAFRALLGRSAYRELGEEFEEREHELLGEGGFQGAVGEVARLEAALGIADLDGFTA
jgi:hemerythrin-like domain-containing protein